ncbi:MAG: TerC family protein [Bradyrhizobiaceae bacterium]|nr:TerC family protein [Bradyrhizobiaceae bacterium]
MELTPFIFSPEGLIAVLTLTILEIVLGIDNVIFVSILVGRLPQADQGRARFIGLGLALVLRLIFLAAAAWIAGLTQPLFTVGPIPILDIHQEISGRDLIMLAGGLFLLGKATSELYLKIESPAEASQPKAAKQQGKDFAWMIMQIVLLDIVFSVDSVITAIGLTKDYIVMSVAVVIAVGVMLWTSGSISRFIEKHPSIKILALAFLLMIGMVLVAEGLDAHIPKGYVYFAMAFSIGVEMLNLRFRAKHPENGLR